MIFVEGANLELVGHPNADTASFLHGGHRLLAPKRDIDHYPLPLHGLCSQ